MKTPKEMIDYGIYIDDAKAVVVCTHEFELGRKDSVVIYATGYPDTKSYCKAVVTKLEDPHRIVIFGPSEIKYRIYTLLEQRPFLGISSKEIVISRAMGTADDAEQFTSKHYEARPSF